MRKPSFKQDLSNVVQSEIGPDYSKVVAVGDNIDKVVDVADNLDVINAAMANNDFVNAGIAGANIGSVDTVAESIVEVNSLAGIKVKLVALYADLSKIVTVADDTVAINSLYTDKVTLNSLYADKAKLDSLFADKAKLDSIAGDKVKLDALYASKTAIDTLYDNLSMLANVATNTQEILDAAVNAGVSEDNALQSAVYAEDSAETTQKLVVGAHWEAPTTIHNGKPLVPGSMYYDLTFKQVRVYNGTGWELGISYDGNTLLSFNDRIGDITLTKSDVDGAVGFITLEFTQTEKDKLGNISVTQPVDLDTVESDTGLNNAHRISDGSDHGFIDQDVTTTGNPTFNSIVVATTVNGRDIDVDGAKLDTIETGATADQTATEIEGLYEGLANTNKYTDADKYNVNAVGMNAAKELAAMDITGMSYDTDGNLVGITYSGTSNSEVFSYNTNGDLSNIEHTLGGTIKGNTALSYDSNGNLISVVFTAV